MTWVFWFRSAYTSYVYSILKWIKCVTALCLRNSVLLLSCFSHVQLCDPIDSSPPGSPISGILQARTLEWVAISFSSAWKWKVKVNSLSRLLSDPMDCKPTRLLRPWDFPGKSTGVGCHFLLRRNSICFKKLHY